MRAPARQLREQRGVPGVSEKAEIVRPRILERAETTDPDFGVSLESCPQPASQLAQREACLPTAVLDTLHGFIPHKG